jgi:acetolactate decarboxylase
MIKTLMIASFLALLVTLPAMARQTLQVEHYGALRAIMHQGDLSAQAEMSDFIEISNFYALGALENLKGEIQIFNGADFSTRADNDQVNFTEPFNDRAALLVTAVVDEWMELPIDNVDDYSGLQQIVEEKAQTHGIDMSEPFPFLVEGTFEQLRWHVIDWPEGDTEHTHEKHQTTGPHGVLSNEPVTLLGFWSDSHHGVFTHHAANIHIHFKTSDQSLAGHVDDLKSGTEITLKLPVMK